MADAWEAGQIYAIPQQLTGGVPQQEPQLSNTAVGERTMLFVRTYDRDGVFVYREALLRNQQQNKLFLDINLEDLKGNDEELADLVSQHPAEYLPVMEVAVKEVLLGLRPELPKESIPPIQITFSGQLPATSIREITAEEVNKLLQVPGIVIQAQRTKPRAVVQVIECKNCAYRVEQVIPPGFASVAVPRKCPGRSAGENGGAAVPAAECPMDPFIVKPDECKWIDQQTLKLQEAPEVVPTGELPRHIMMTVDRCLADRIPPGSRITVLGIASVTQSMTASASPGNRASGRSTVRTPYLRVVGVEFTENGTGRAVSTFTPEEEQSFKTLASDPNVFDRLADNVAPSISGDYTDDIKKAILCLLLGGSRKLLPDGQRLRGDINVLLLGDPSTAKSQFLKFVEKVAPVGVYTSGKGSSAAGLTASVLKSASGEFYLEGGAMVMADGGVVCIDEFDKMREEDRVAIHEAMEQQTISVAKAGITTILNSRCSVLAAANPVYGRYDDSKTATENIDLLPTILSRFDLIFIVRDTRDTERDLAIARHVVGVHVNFKEGGDGVNEATAGATGAGAGASDKEKETGTDVDIATMKKFITFARNKCAPRLSQQAGNLLASKYADIRSAHSEREAKARDAERGSEDAKDASSVIPITVRQLEALVRVTESIAKAGLRPEAGEGDVNEALRLFTKSTLTAAAAGLGTAESMSADAIAKVRAVEARINRMIQPGDAMPLSKVKDRLLQADFDESIVNMALRAMERRDEVRLVNERRTVQRLRV